jgi:nicotinamide-nucleotide amidase
MEFETKVLSRQIQEALYNHNETLGTAESCTGGRIAEAIISVPGASQYFKGGVVSYTNEVKENLLHVSAQVLAEQTAVCEEVAREMVIGACDALNCDYAISATGVAGPGGGTAEIPVGTIWLGYGSKDDVRTFKLTDDFGRDINLEIATNKALRLFLEYVNARHTEPDSEGGK